MVLVTGASGQVGCSVIKALHNKGITTKAFIHNVSNTEKVKSIGATEIFVGDMTNEDDLRTSLKGVDSVYYICNAANPKEDEIGAIMIKIAKEIGGIYFIYHSVMHSVLQDMPHHKRKLRVEQMVVNSGLDYTIIQPAVFMQTLMPAVMSVKNGEPLLQKFFTSNNTKISMVDMEDFAEAVAFILCNREYINGTFELCSSGSYTLKDMEAIFAEIIGKEVKATFISDEEFLSQMKLESTSYQAQTLLTMFRHYNEHSFTGNSFVLKKILGREPNDLNLFVKRYVQ